MTIKFEFIYFPFCFREGEVNEQENDSLPVVEEMTLEEYFALRGKRERPQYNLRKAGEGEDLSQWKNMYEIKKKRDSEQPEEEVRVC